MNKVWLWLVLAAAAVTALNACKPLCGDDGIYYHYARHIAGHPLDPYGFHLLGGQHANEVLAPPAFLYYWAGAMRLLGDSLLLWKLSLFPIHLLAAWVLWQLFRTFARGVEIPLVLAVLCSPLILPSINMMLDVPALTLALSALATLMAGCRRGSWGLALLAGCLAGLAMQTKYTAFTAPPLLVLYAWATGRARYGLFAAGLGCLLFASWEGYIAFRYGDAHVLLALGQRTVTPFIRLRLALPLVSTLGALAGWTLPLAAASLVSRRLTRTSLGTVVGGMGLVLLPEAWHPWGPEMTSKVVFGTLGALLCGVVGWVVILLARQPDLPGVDLPGGRINRFLALWFAVEVVGYFALSPYPAVRRCLSLHVVGVLLLARLLVLRSDHLPAPDRGVTWLPTGLSTVLGLGCLGIGAVEGWTEARAAESTLREIRAEEPEAEIWCQSYGTFSHRALLMEGKRVAHAGFPATARDRVVVMTPVPDPAIRERLRTAFRVCERQRFYSPFPVHTRFQWGGSPLKTTGAPLFEVVVFRPADSAE